MIQAPVSGAKLIAGYATPISGRPKLPEARTIYKWISSGSTVPFTKHGRTGLTR
jgi:hypothetical protein